MPFRPVLLTILCFITFYLIGVNPLLAKEETDKNETQIESDSFEINKKVLRKKRLKAAALTILVGPFGGHRIYLGTDHKIPIAYSLTLGGVGILPLIDLIAILASKNPDQYFNSNRVFMWDKEREP